MPESFGRCLNADYCALGDARSVLRIDPEAPFICPECAHALAPVARWRHPREAGMLVACMLGMAASAALAFVAVHGLGGRHGWQRVPLVTHLARPEPVPPPAPVVVVRQIGAASYTALPLPKISPVEMSVLGEAEVTPVTETVLFTAAVAALPPWRVAALTRVLAMVPAAVRARKPPPLRHPPAQAASADAPAPSPAPAQAVPAQAVPAQAVPAQAVPAAPPATAPPATAEATPQPEAPADADDGFRTVTATTHMFTLPANARMVSGSLDNVTLPASADPPPSAQEALAHVPPPSPVNGVMQIDCAIELTGIPSDCHVVSAHGTSSGAREVVGWLMSGGVKYAPALKNGHPVVARRQLVVNYQPPGQAP